MENKLSTAKLREKNPMWGIIKKEKPGYSALHQWVRRRLEKPLVCDHCGEVKKLDLANKSQEYRRALDDWLWLCKKCHFDYDGLSKYLEYGRTLKKGRALSSEHKRKLSESHVGQIAWNKSLPIEKACEECGITIIFVKWEARRFCSRRCAMLFNKNWLKRKALQ